MGSGVGRTLWADLEAATPCLGARPIAIAADPVAAGFYEAMGMQPTVETPSGSIPGCKLPVLELIAEI